MQTKEENHWPLDTVNPTKSLWLGHSLWQNWLDILESSKKQRSMTQVELTREFSLMLHWGMLLKIKWTCRKMNTIMTRCFPQSAVLYRSPLNQCVWSWIVHSWMLSFVVYWLSHIWLSATPWTVPRLLRSWDFQGKSTGCWPFPSPGDPT